MNFSAKTHVLSFIPPPHQTSHQALAIVFSMALRSVPSTPFPPTWPQLNLPSCYTGITTQGPPLFLSLLTILLAAEEGIVTKHGLSPNFNGTSAPLGSRLASQHGHQPLPTPWGPPRPWAPAPQTAHGMCMTCFCWSPCTSNSSCLCFKYRFYFTQAR